MIFFMTCIHVKWVVSKKNSFPSSVIRGEGRGIHVGGFLSQLYVPPTIIRSWS